MSDLLHSRLSEASDANNTLNCTDYLLKEINEGLKAKKLLDKNLEEDINNYKNLLSEVSLARKRCSASKFVIETVEDVLENSSELPVGLKKKCSQRIRHSTFLRNPNNSDLLKATGLDVNLDSLELTLKERKSIHSAVKEALDRKIAQQKIDNDVVQGEYNVLRLVCLDRKIKNYLLILDFLGNFSENIPLPGSTITEENIRVISLISEVGETIKSCFGIASSIVDAIKEICDFHVQKFQKLHKEELNCLSSRIKLLELKLK